MVSRLAKKIKKCQWEQIGDCKTMLADPIIPALFG